MPYVLADMQPSVSPVTDDAQILATVIFILCEVLHAGAVCRCHCDN